MLRRRSAARRTIMYSLSAPWNVHSTIHSGYCTGGHGLAASTVAVAVLPSRRQVNSPPGLEPRKAEA
jgi:hypothetical protein